MDLSKTIPFPNRNQVRPNLSPSPRKPSQEAKDALTANKHFNSLPGEMPLIEAAQRMEKFEGAQRAKREAQFRQFDSLLTNAIFNDYCVVYDIELRRRYGGTPRDLDAEQAIFGAALMPGEMEAVEILVRRLRPWHLANTNTHTPILMAFAALYQRHRGDASKVDLITVTGELRRMGALAHSDNPLPNSDVIPQSYLVALIENCPGAANIDSYIDSVIECAQLRQLARLSEHLNDLTLQGQTPPLQVLNFLRKATDAIEQGKGAPDFEALLEQTK